MITKTMVTKTSIRMGNIGTHWGVVDEGGGSRDYSGSSSKNSSISLTSLPLSGGSSSSNKSKVSSLSFSNLRGVNNWFRSNTSVHWGNKRLWVEGGSNQGLWVEGGSNRETRVSNTESCSISNILNLLELSVGVNIRVSTRDSSISVSHNMSVGVDVSVAVVQVAKLILGMELATSSVGSSSNHWSSSSYSGSSGISNSGSSSNSGSISSIGWSSGSNSGSSGISNSRSSSSYGSSSSNRGSGVRKASISSIGKATIGVTISQGRGNNLCLLSNAHGKQSRQGNKSSHDVTRYVMLNGVPM